jgi:hypothetical protein
MYATLLLQQVFFPTICGTCAESSGPRALGIGLRTFARGGLPLPAELAVRLHYV